MKTIKTAAVLAVACIGLVASSARAQERIVVKVPFPFVVHGEQLPAGNYDITADAGILAIRGTDGRGSAFAIAEPEDGHDPAGDEPSLVFVRYENQNLLSEIWESGTEGLALPPRAVTPRRDQADAHAPSSTVVTSDVEVHGK